MTRPGDRVRFCPGPSLFGEGTIPHADEAGQLVAKVKPAPGEDPGPARWLVRFDGQATPVEILEADLIEAPELFDIPSRPAPATLWSL